MQMVCPFCHSTFEVSSTFSRLQSEPLSAILGALVPIQYSFGIIQHIEKILVYHPCIRQRGLSCRLNLCICHHKRIQQWIELYGEEDDRKGKEDEMMQVDDEGEDDDEEGDVDSSTSDSVESEESDSDESEDEEDEKEDYSEAEESDEEDEEDVKLSQEQQDALTNKLLELRTRQSQEQQAFIARLEAQAKARGKPETPDDYVFGNGK